MAEYIEREALYEQAYWHGEHPDVDNPFPDGVDAIDIKDVDAIPAADVAPVRHGRWINYGDGVCCSVCESERPTKANDHKLSVKEVNFCYYCGAKMDLED